MMIQNSLNILKELSKLEEKIQELEKALANSKLNVDKEEFLTELISKNLM